MQKFLLCILMIFVFALIGQQPAPYIQEDISIQPIVENYDLGAKYWYIKSIKIYYKDPLKKPIRLNNKDSLYNYCSDSTLITFKSVVDSLQIPSIKRMSCEILAIININKRDSEWLKTHIVSELTVLNTATNNKIIVYIDDTEYFRRLILKYNANY